MRNICFALCVVALATVSVMTSCSKDDDEQKGTAKVNVRLADGPVNYDAVNINIKQVEIQTDAGGWVTVDILHPGVYNLLDFNNGIDTLLCQATLPAGNISQMRLILGDGNTVVIDGTSYPLETPSAQQSGLKFNIHQELVANGSYDIWIDFDASRSIVRQGNGGYSLKPVVRAYTALTNGKIKGYVLPPAAFATVYAVNGTDTFAAIPDVATGYFMFCGMPEGNYSLWVDAMDTTPYNDTMLNNVTVSFGIISDVGVITLTP